MRLPKRRAALPAAVAAYARAPLPPRRTPWRAAGWCAVDLELSGLDPRQHEIISFGAIPVEDGRVLLRDTVGGLVRPSRPLSEASIRIHGIRAADLADAPPLEQAIEPLLAAMTGRVVVVHYAPVERAFLGPALRRLGVRLRGPLVDTSVLGRVWLNTRDGSAPPWLSLPGLAKALGVPAQRPHNALGDALTTAQAFVAVASHLDVLRPETVKTLARAEARLQSLVAYPRGG